MSNTFLAILLTLFALQPIRQWYSEYKLERLGIPMTVEVADVPIQNYRNIVKTMYVAIGGLSIPVRISGPDYHDQRFKVGQKINVKYHAPSGRATLSGEFNWRIVFSASFFGGLAVYFWFVSFNTRKDRY